MPNEVTWQRKVIVKIYVEGGWARKWATQLSVGVPDLIVAHEQFGLAGIEVKLEKN